MIQRISLENNKKQVHMNVRIIVIASSKWNEAAKQLIHHEIYASLIRAIVVEKQQKLFKWKQHCRL
jgi:hypothetical protein